MKKILYSMLALAVLSMTGCGTADASQAQGTPQESSISFSESTTADTSYTAGANASNSDSQTLEKPVVPDFELEASNGETITLSDQAGKVVVLNFWASWCSWCVKEMPDFQKLHDELKDSDEVVLLMLNQTDGRQETKQVADKFLSENDFEFLTLYDTGEVGYATFGLQGLPATVVLDKEGRLSGYVLGKTDYDTVIGMIEEAKAS